LSGQSELTFTALDTTDFNVTPFGELYNTRILEAGAYGVPIVVSDGELTDTATMFIDVFAGSGLSCDTMYFTQYDSTKFIQSIDTVWSWLVDSTQYILLPRCEHDTIQL